jgi:hypothetical protein
MSTLPADSRPPRPGPRQGTLYSPALRGRRVPARLTRCACRSSLSELERARAAFLTTCRARLPGLGQRNGLSWMQFTVGIVR